VACADVAKAKAKATAINLIIVSSHTNFREEDLLESYGNFTPPTRESLTEVKDLMGAHAAKVSRDTREERVMIDDHAKAILTVIAASLLILAVQQVVKPASAQIGGQCGYSRDVPCYITIIPPG
jgi:hypothetical protein